MPRPLRTWLAAEALEGRDVPAAGDLDPRFGSQGVVQYEVPVERFGQEDPFDTRQLVMKDAAVLPNGGLVGVGRVGFTYGEYDLGVGFRPIIPLPDLNTAEDTRDFAIVRFTSDGAPAASFGGTGTPGLARVAIDVIDEYLGDEARAVGLQRNPNGRRTDLADANLIVGGVAGLPVMRGLGRIDDFGPQTGARIAVLARVDQAGALDGTFGPDANGIVQFQFDTGGTGYSAAVSDLAVYNPDLGIGTAADADKIVVVSDMMSNPDFPFPARPRMGLQVVRFNPDGTFDTAFGPRNDGRVFIDLGVLANFGLDPLPRGPVPPGVNPERPVKVLIQPDGKVVVAGAVRERNGQVVVARLNTDGSLDAGFGTGGVFNVPGLVAPAGLVSTVGGLEFLEKVGEGGPDRLLVAGGDGSDFFVAKITAGATGAGTPDTTFGAGGIARVSIETGQGDGVDAATGIAVQPDGKIVLGGRANQLSRNVDAFAVARLTRAGQPDATLNGGGTRVFAQQVGTGAGFGTAGSEANLFGLGGKMVLLGDQETTNGKFRDGRFRPNNTRLAAVQLTNDSEFDLPPIQPPPPDPSRFAVRNGFAATGAAGTVAVVPFSTDDRLPGNQVNPAAVTDLPVVPTALPFGGVYQVATADVNGDDALDFVVATGPGAPARFAVVSGADNTTLLVPPTPVFPGSEDFAGGVFVSAGDIDGQVEVVNGEPIRRAEMVFTPNVGGGPRVTVYSFAGGRLAVAANFFGIADPNFRGGARSAVGDVNGDGKGDLLVAAGVGGGPRVALYNGATVLGNNRSRLVNDFFAFDPSLRDGVFAAIGDLNGDGKGDPVFGAGAGGAPRVLAVSGQVLVGGGGARAAFAAPVANFFVGGNDTARGGARVAVADADGDNLLDLAVGTGDDGRVRVYRAASIIAAGGAEPTNDFQEVDPFGSGFFPDGVFVG